MSGVNVSTMGLTEVQVLRALYNRARPMGAGFLHYRPGDMTEAEAEAQLAGETDDVGLERRRPKYFDYVRGRVMKVNLDTVKDGFIDPRLYDRDNGRDAAKDAIEAYALTVNTEKR